MKISVFRRKITPKNGNKTFTKYVTTLTNKQGDNLYCDVVFSEGIATPNTFPCVVEFNKEKANLSRKKKEYTDNNTGERKEYVRNTLWINEISNVSEYVDHSLDDFE